ncbi:MAG TPA: hypothetical protein VKX28_13395 [Xanthobacteraceae bacterium]|nr:hypothetical protein [Xanthobacteraceae bacterium]
MFRDILSAAKAAGYAFARFDRAPAEGKVFFLRHDVDISARNALVLGRLAQEQGVQSNFFFQLNAETYSIFSDEVIGIMRTLRAAGHCVGLHIDETRFGDDERVIRRTIDWFSSSVLAVDDVMSFHRPSRAVLGRSYAAFINAYDPRFFSPESYLSDSRRSLAFLPTLAQWMDAGRPRLQLLLHPEWWTGINDDRAIWTELRDRRQHDLEQYLMLNCRKVFGHVIAPEARDFRV